MSKYFTSTIPRVALVSVVCISLFMACRKESKLTPQEPAPDSTASSTARSDEDSLKYMMYRIMQVTYVNNGRNTTTTLPTYFWYSQVPSLDPFSSDYGTADVLLEAMKAYPKNAGNGMLDRYSFLDRTGSLSNKLQNGVSETNFKGSANGDFGMEVSFALDADSKSHLFILYADKNSAAGKQGLQRGDEITAINGDTNIEYDGASGTNTKKVTNAIYNSNSVTLAVTKAVTSANTTLTLQTAPYNINPVLFDTTYNINGQKTGYFVFYTFASTYNTAGAATNTKNVLDQVFAKFKTAGITNLIVDLRYNGGGAVTTAEYLDSVIAPATAQSKVMYYYQYNDVLTSNLENAGLEASVNFPASTGGFSLNNVFFITGRSTASASELTLNNLKPYMNVKLVGDTTFGKPVGFISFTISKYDSTHMEKYLADLYAINFATENASHAGEYYSGIAPDQTAIDYVNLPWGSDGDDHLLQIFNYIKTGAFARTADNARIAAANNLKAGIPSSIPSPRFNGMVDYRLGKTLK